MSKKLPFKFSARTRVGFSDTDAQGIVYYGRYNPYFDLARVEYLRSLGLLHRTGGGEFVMRANDVEYFAPARFDDELDVHARCRDLRGARFRYEYAIVRADGLPVADGWTAHACVDAETFRPTRVPDWLAVAIHAAEG